jgi:protein TonB
MDQKEPHPTREPESMFHLLASKPPRRGKREAATLVTSIALHGAVAGGLIWATLAVGEEVAEEAEEVTIIEVTEEVPPPPPPPPEPEAPPPPEVEAKGFQTLATPVIVPPDIPPPGEKVEEADFSGEGVEGGIAEGVEMPAPVPEETTFSFTPYTVKPRCRSGCSADDILRHVPPMLKRSGVQCELTVGIRIDTAGNVTSTDLLKSSGNEACDRSAQEWARTTTWTTAYNRDQAVIVWIAQPVSIQTQ